MNRMDFLCALALLLSLGLGLGAGCGDDGNGASNDDGGASAGDGDGDGDGPPAVVPIEPTFADISERIFVRSCGFSSCHDNVGPEEGMDLITDPYSAIVNVEANGAPGKILVVPFEPDNSYLLEKIEKMMPTAGTQMPPGQPLPQQKLDAIREWILMGALSGLEDGADAGEDAGI